MFGRTVGYLKERKQFGKLIGEFQALQHRAAQLYIEIEMTRAAVLKALQTLDADFANAGAAVAVAKARAGTTATLAVQEGVQMHGGMGMTDQFDIGFFMKRARVCQELFGDSQFPRRPAGADEELLRAPCADLARAKSFVRHSGARVKRANSESRKSPECSASSPDSRLRGFRNDLGPHRIGGAYWMPPVLQSWFRPRGNASFEPAPTLRS